MQKSPPIKKSSSFRAPPPPSIQDVDRSADADWSPSVSTRSPAVKPSVTPARASKAIPVPELVKAFTNRAGSDLANGMQLR